MIVPATPLAPKDVAELLRAGGEALKAELTALPASVQGWHAAPAEWCAKEVLGHLIEAERRGFAGRVRAILGEHEPKFAAWDPDVVARERRDCDRDVKELLEEFGGLRASSVLLVAGLKEGDLARGGHHPKVGYLRISDLLHEWVHHDRNHMRQVFANVQAFVWPSMGNTQRFSEPDVAPGGKP
jgi:hypothetical protein